MAMLYAPEPSAVPVPIWVLPSYSVTVLPASAFPVKVGEFTFVRPDEGGTSVGTVGAFVSTVKLNTEDVSETFKTLSVATAAIE